MRGYIIAGIVAIAVYLFFRMLSKIGDMANKLDNAKMNYKALLEENEKLKKENEELNKKLNRQKAILRAVVYSSKEKE